jgi:hypothetical protein
MYPKIITPEWLRRNPDCIFVFGDNTIRRGKGGAAVCRDEPNTYGFITKKFPNNEDNSFYRPDEYRPIFKNELVKLIATIGVTLIVKPDTVFIIAALGRNLANRYHIHEEIIQPSISKLPYIFREGKVILNW